MVGFNAQPLHWITLQKFLITLVTQFGSTCTALLWAVTSSVETLVWKVTDILFLTNCAYCSLLLSYVMAFYRPLCTTNPQAILNYPYLTSAVCAAILHFYTTTCACSNCLNLSVSFSVRYQCMNPSITLNVCRPKTASEDPLRGIFSSSSILFRYFATCISCTFIHLPLPELCKWFYMNVNIFYIFL